MDFVHYQIGIQHSNRRHFGVKKKGGRLKIYSLGPIRFHHHHVVRLIPSSEASYTPRVIQGFLFQFQVPFRFLTVKQ